ncbi:glycoside hydrolase family 13 protein [Actinomadura atramentaria]|uniref:glycoside hydrolase family 13 protein n=1 Tax=Actinomadura atramentaria TaxID=1990 RepID=UPI000374A71C|nr:glycoside hydrolase family 13 protein [Actinomadura atramentaria]
MTRTPWWRDAVVYEVYVRSFADSDGDGDGDLRGVRSRLGYLRDLGVDALWLTPFYRSPLADGGYDVADYRAVDPRFGSLDDFDALVADAHAHGLRLMVDIVPNHTSDRHPWFREALAAPPGSPERERYVFRRGAGDAPPTDWPSAFGGPAWTRLPDGDWYLHLYAPEQPDLNWRDPRVRAEFEDILRFWLDRGVDGFRIDVAAGLFKDPEFADLGDRGRHSPGSPIYSRPEVHGVYRDWRRLLDSYDGDRMAIGEVWSDDTANLARYLRPDELHQVFQFHLQLAPWSADRFRAVVDETIEAVAPTGAAPTWVLSSHDVVRHVTRYGLPGGPPGIGAARARAALLFLLALPGSAYLYQGEELGLPEVMDIPGEARRDPIWTRSGGTALGRDGCRVPLPWSGTAAPFGFGPPATNPWLPMPDAWRHYTAEAQETDPDSMLTFYRRALAQRRALPPDLPGTVEWPDAPQGSLLLRRGPLTCAVNFGDRPIPLPPGRPLLTSATLDGTLLPGSSAAWLTTT